jgi:hypothetical protein
LHGKNLRAKIIELLNETETINWSGYMGIL